MSVGEEVINNSRYTHREENCFAERDTALFCIEREKWITAREKILYEAFTKKSPRRDAYEKLNRDITVLDEVFRFNYI